MSLPKRILIIPPVLVLLLGTICIFNRINITIRLHELSQSLRKNTVDVNSLDHMGLLMTYQLHQRLYDGRITPDQSDITELRILSLIKESETVRSGNRLPAFLSPALHMINGMRHLIKKQPLIWDIEDDPSQAILSLAYYYERNRKYSIALDQYRKLEKINLDNETHAGILLHEGFCQSMLGDFPSALKLYRDVINNYPESNACITASIMLHKLVEFRSEAENVMASEKDSVVKGEKLFRLISFREALKVLESIEKEAPESEKARINYYRARCHEELSEGDNALKAYQSIINNSRDKDIARSANRRILLIGTALSGDNALQTLSMKNNQVLNDPSLEQMNTMVRQLSPRNEIKINAQNIISPETITMMEKAEVKPAEPLKKPSPVIRKVKIYTREGNIFVGTIAKETDNILTLTTGFGTVYVERSTIDKIEPQP